MKEIMEAVRQKAKLVIVSEYNPAIEKFKTGKVITDIFETLLIGWIS